MRSRLRGRATVWHLRPAVLTMALVLCIGPWAAQAQKTATTAEQQEAAGKDFTKRLNAYVDLRANLAKELKPLSPTASASELASRQESLAAALRLARKVR